MSEDAGSGVAQPLIWLREQQVASLVDLNDAIEALRVGLKEEADGQARAIDKAFGTWPDGAMHALGSLTLRRHYAGFKTWAHTPKGATAIFSLFDTRNGRLLAVLEAATLGQIRTSAISGLGADILSVSNADELAIVGTGAQALTQVAAVAGVRPLRRLKVFSPTSERRRAFVERARQQFAFEVVECHSVDEAVADAPMVTLITRTREPFLSASMVAPGALVIAAGAILPANAEFTSDVLDRTGAIVVDSLANARAGSRELRDYFEHRPEGWADVKTLGQILADGGRLPIPRDITLFKPMGSGLSDLSVAITAYERAMESGIGLSIDQPRRVMPNWRPQQAAV